MQSKIVDAAPLRLPTRWTEWLTFSMIAVGLVLALEHSGWLQAPNRLFHDTLMSLQGHEVDRGDVIIVGIDDKSIAALGRWPWRRSFHAELIDRIDKDAPQAIGLDVLLTEADERFPGDDAALAAAVSRSGKVVLPLMMQSLNGAPFVVEPIPALRRAARRLGHVHIAVDDDGIARSVYLREGFGDRAWDHLSVAMRTAGAGGRPEPVAAPEERASEAETANSDPIAAWHRSRKMIVPFAGPPGHFPQVSYVDVLDGAVAPGTFKGKHVLIGATAAGTGELYATPVSGRRSKLMSGAEFSANVLDSLESRRSITRLPGWLNAALNILPALLGLAGMAFIGPLPALLLTLGLMVALPAAAAAAAGFGLQFGPAAGMLALGANYALWSWRKLDASTRYLMDEFSRLHSNGRLVAMSPGTAASGDFLGRRIHALRQVAEQLSNLHRFVSDSLEGLPDATLVCDRNGTVLLANAAAARHFEAASGEMLRGAKAATLMKDVLSQADRQPVVIPAIFAGPPTAGSTAAHDGRERDLLVKRAPSFSGSGEHLGWILSLIDVTQIRQAQRQRDHAMRFLSHDMRAPLASVLTLLNLQRQNPSAMPQEQFHERIERHAKKALGLADDFTQLVRAQSYNYHFERYNLVDVLLECVDDAWEATRRHRIRVTMAPSPEEAHSLINRELIARAINNLLGNALKFSPAGSSIVCAVEPHPRAWAVLVRDEGPGIAEELRAQVFEPFIRGSAAADIDGAGLGLAFVKTVAQRHGGKVLLDSTPGHGSAFRLVLPRDELP
ncbi:histidine kinase [Variovorax sp. WS11]|uniref:CHASE2 domain-containing protein n=1 Tax=Variovorax sp. WS11 TaxID=1105204 RepID=UPI000D0D0F86|nr:CHASE2 domain-containing protein [Variovorax sp. WS11]NDZ13474.1 CHASE2 domain-containing protein [Variovorax sp. WS11]PSL84420.1 histidine kinase [Variovorax sp. WS11]